MNYPKITIITVCLNSEKTIERTIQSVLSQSYDQIEYIIIDGKSSDNTLQIVNKYQSQISRIVSEKDGGIYDAMNKGVRLMTGDVVIFINSGDYLYDSDVLRDVAEVFKEEPKTQILYGNLVYEDKGNQRLRKYSKIDRLFFVCSTICHQVIFAKKEVFSRYGYFNEKYVRNADYDWLLNVFFREDVITRYLDRTITVYNMQGMSAPQHKYLKEVIVTKRKYFSCLNLLLSYPVCLIRQRFRKMFL